MNSPIKGKHYKVCNTPDYGTTLMDRIWICDDCGTTYAGGVAIRIQRLDGSYKYCCLYCRDRDVEKLLDTSVGSMRDVRARQDRVKYKDIYGEEPEKESKI